MTRHMRVSDPAAMHARTAAVTEAAVARVLSTGRWVGGETVQAAEQAVAEVMGLTFGVGTGSGTSALQLALEALGVGPGDEVVVPAVSFVATATAVLRTGAQPVCVDVLPGLPLICPEAVRGALSVRTRAVVTVSLFGNPPPALTLPAEVTVVEDAAQAVGSAPWPTDAVARTASFYPTKVLAAAGDGGLVATNHASLAERVRALGSHGRGPDGRYHRVGGRVAGNDRLDAVQAAILLARLPDLDARVAHRRGLLRRYRERLPELVLPHDPRSNVSVLAAVHPERDRLRQRLSASGIETACYYPHPLSSEPALGNGGTAPQSVVRAEAFCRQSFALPCHIGIGLSDVDRVCDVLQELI